MRERIPSDAGSALIGVRVVIDGGAEHRDFYVLGKVVTRSTAKIGKSGTFQTFPATGTQICCAEFPSAQPISTNPSARPNAAIGRHNAML